jgi:hemerythrin-like domain-containing protein
MSGEKIREAILAEHGQLRRMLDELAPLADRFETGETGVGVALRDAARALYETFAAHLAREEHSLEPALRGLGTEGQRMADRLAREHAEQRELLTYLVGRLRNAANPTLLVAREVRNFIEYLRLDMTHEETTLLPRIG